MSNYKTITVHSRTHVLTDYDRNNKVYPNPNYKNTGMALVGILRKDETLKEWILRAKITDKKEE